MSDYCQQNKSYEKQFKRQTLVWGIGHKVVRKAEKVKWDCVNQR